MDPERSENVWIGGVWGGNMNDDRLQEMVSIPIDINMDVKEIERVVRRQVGSSVFLSKHSRGEKGHYNFGVIIEKHLWDSKDERGEIRFVPFEGIFQASRARNENGIYLSIPPREAIIDKIRSRISGFRTSSERFLLEAVGTRFLGVYQIQNQMNPIFEIIANVILENKITASDFVHGGRTEQKVKQYLTFLAQLDILKRENGNFVPGRVIESRMDLDMNSGEFYKAVLAESIQKGHDFMADFLHFTHITPFVRLVNASFLPSFYADRPLSMTEEDLSEYQLDLYGTKPRPLTRVRARATQMTQIGVFSCSRKGSQPLFSGSNEVFEKYADNWKGEAFQFISE